MTARVYFCPPETMFKDYQNTPNGGDFTFRFIVIIIIIIIIIIHSTEKGVQTKESYLTRM